ncbi:hypothetical protein OUZ56_030940 [Daphnia magna]|uniref:Uncharacterized protein n=1 Tax=Daphnia magna TaxID=35525 RepID=A0ABQ9ZST1_9CRUS|nr:hypothetical protein OUZ56_030940 [Daphnia magna]
MSFLLMRSLYENTHGVRKSHNISSRNSSKDVVTERRALHNCVGRAFTLKNQCRRLTATSLSLLPISGIAITDNSQKKT